MRLRELHMRLTMHSTDPFWSARHSSTLDTKSRARTHAQAHSRQPLLMLTSTISSARGSRNIPSGWTRSQRTRQRGCCLARKPSTFFPHSNPSSRSCSHHFRTEANFKHHPQSVTPSSKVKLVRYQQNPTPNWGPGAKPRGKRKRNEDE